MQNEKLVRKNEKMKIITISFMFLGMLIINSCNNTEIFSKEIKLPHDKWTYSDSLKGTFEIKDTSETYDLLLNLSHKDAYPFQNIYLRITDDFTGITKTDTVNINLSDEYGIWKGKSIAGDKSISTILRKKFRFKEIKNYNFTIEQFSRNDTLSGITKAGLAILRTE